MVQLKKAIDMKPEEISKQKVKQKQSEYRMSLSDSLGDKSTAEEKQKIGGTFVRHKEDTIEMHDMQYNFCLNQFVRIRQLKYMHK